MATFIPQLDARFIRVRASDAPGYLPFPVPGIVQQYLEKHRSRGGVLHRRDNRHPQ